MTSLSSVLSYDFSEVICAENDSLPFLKKGKKRKSVYHCNSFEIPDNVLCPDHNIKTSATLLPG